jgi:hypothetical protein
MDADVLKKPFGQDDLQRAIQGVLPACSVDPTRCAGPLKGADQERNNDNQSAGFSGTPDIVNG